MRRFQRWLTLSLLLLVVPLPAAVAEPLAIVGVDVLPMDGARALPAQTVIVKDGRIAAVGGVGDVSVPAAATVIDGGGRWLMPGLFDTHVHLGPLDAEAHLLLYVAHGVTTVQNMSGDEWHLALRDRVAAGELLGPRILTAGPTTATAGVATPEAAKAFVASQAAAGYDLVKMYGDGSGGMEADTYAALIEAAHAAGLRVTGHAPRNQPFSLVLETGQDSIDHLEEVLYTWTPAAEPMAPLLDVQFGRAGPEGTRETLASLRDLPVRLAEEARALARASRAAGIAYTPTLVAFGSIQAQTTTAFAELGAQPALAWIHPLTRLEWGPELNGYRQAWSDRLDEVSEILELGLEIQMALVRPLADAGVPILTGTDAALEYVVPGVSLHREMGLLAAAGLSPFEVLSAATRAPALALGLGAETGLVAPGLRADLVLVEGDPRHGGLERRRIAGVVLAGRWIDRAELDGRLDALAADYRALEQRTAPLLAAFAAEDPEALASAARPLAGAGGAAEEVARRVVDRLGSSALDAGDGEAALGVFRLGTELFPAAAGLWHGLGRSLLRAGRLEEARAALARALEIDPQSAESRTALEWLEPIAEALAEPPTIAAADLARYAGDYGPRHLRLEGDRLLYWRDRNEPRPLVALGDHRFMIEGVFWFVMRFEMGADGRAERLVGTYDDGRQDGAPRDPETPSS